MLLKCSIIKQTTLSVLLVLANYMFRDGQCFLFLLGEGNYAASRTDEATGPQVRSYNGLVVLTV